MRRALTDIGFEVLELEMEWRPTRLTGPADAGEAAGDAGAEGAGGASGASDKETGTGTGTRTTGLEGWVRLMGAEMLARVPEEEDGVRKRDEAVREVCEVLRDVVTREEDGSQWLGYVRLRGVARRV